MRTAPPQSHVGHLNVFIRNKLKAHFHEPTVKVESTRPTECDLVFGSVVKFGGRGRFMRRHLLGMLEAASILLRF
jgi:hypothetical protein